MSLTTSQLLLRLDFGYTACLEGRIFCEEHPDPEEAIAYAVANAQRDPAKTTAMGVEPRRHDPGTFLRWAASDASPADYNALGHWSKHISAHLEGCALILRQWVAKMWAEHAEEARS